MNSDEDLTGVGVLFAEIAVFLRVAKFNGKMISTATGIVILAAAMKVLASACKDFGQMEWSEIGKGLAGIGGLLAELAAFTNLAGNAKHVMSTGVASNCYWRSNENLCFRCKRFRSVTVG